MYRLHDLDNKPVQSGAPRGPFTEDDHGYGAGGLAEPRHSDAWEAPRPSMGPYSEQGGQTQGYVVPESQFEYDTGYYGGHNARR